MTFAQYLTTLDYLAAVHLPTEARLSAARAAVAAAGKTAYTTLSPYLFDRLRAAFGQRR